AAGGGDHGVADAGVAAAAVEDAATGHEAAVALGGEDHRQGGAILDRAAGVEPLALGPQLDAGGDQALDRPAEPDQRGVAYAGEDDGGTDEGVLGRTVDGRGHGPLRDMATRREVLAPRGHG